MKKQDVLDYYNAPHIQDSLLRNFYGDEALTLVRHDVGKPFYRRNIDGNPIKLNNPGQLQKLLAQRTIEFHPSIGKSTNVLWVDIDPGKDISTHELKPIVKQIDTLVRGIPEVTRTSVAFSGGRGFYVRGYLKDDMPTDDARKLLEEKLKPLTMRDQKLVLAPPKSSQVRLDTSTLHNKGSIRGLYSLNHETGLASVPVKRHELNSFNPNVDANPKKLMSSEFAPGIPRDKKTHDIPTTENSDWMMSVQHHDAVKAGPHWDLRLIDPDTNRAHSWAIPKSKFPESGGKPLLAVQTQTHTSDYSLNFGAKGPEQIHSGYGRGSVEIKHKEPITIVSSKPDSLKFERTVGDNKKERYALVRTNKDKWLMRNISEKVASDYYWLGYHDMLRKLGAEESAVDSPDQGQTGEASTSESGLPLATSDENTGAGQLAKLFNNLDVDSPDMASTSSMAGNPVDKHLERPSDWGNPFSVGAVSGSTPIIPGGSF